MKKLFITSLILISSFCFSQNSEWTYIFDGKSFDGWHQYNGESVGSQWSISNGELIFTNNRDSKQDLVTVNEYSNFELSIEWNISRGGNSGVFFGVKELPEFDEAYITGPEIQVLDNENFCCPNTEYHLAPALYDMKPIEKIKYNPYGEWNHLILKVDHNKNEGSITFNGEFVYSFPLYGQEWNELVSRSKFFTFTVKCLNSFLSIASFFSNCSITFPFPFILKCM